MRRIRASAIAALWFATLAEGCSCEGDPLEKVRAQDASPADDAEAPPDTPPPADGGAELDAGECRAAGVVKGRVCSPQARDWVAGAVVTLSAYDCHGESIDLTAVSDMNGAFEIDRVPAGHWTISAEAGAFMRTFAVDVQDGQTTSIPEDQLCVVQNVKIAVITGQGDHIETLLMNLGINVDTFDGGSGYMTSAAPFLADLGRMRMYDLIFLDCAAATTHGQVNLGPNASQIAANLHQYVVGGGSVYGSDWAVAILALAFPDVVQPKLSNGGTVSDPFATNQLIGYAPQTVMARVPDRGLATALNASQVSISFPDQSGARSSHWGLISMPGSGARILVESSVSTCDPDAMYCDSRAAPGASTTASLAIAFKLTPQDQRGGNVFYTSFHNIAQQGNDVAAILKYIVFHL
jgi:hypothetical protein